MGTAFLYGNGGSGGTGATLTVTAPAGCTVTISKDGKTLTRVAGADGIVVFRGLQSGIWTLSGTDGTHTNSKTVEIVADYAVMMDYKLMLYDNGDQCVDVTGGWVKRGVANGMLTIGNVSFNAESMTLNVKSVNSGKGQYNIVFSTTSNVIDVTHYNKISVVVTESTIASAVVLFAEDSSWNDYTSLAKRVIQKGETGIIDLDISSISGFGYVGFLAYAESGQSGIVTIAEANLE